MKKVLILSIVCAMVLAGCGKNKEGTEQPVVATQTTVAESDNLSELDIFKDVKVEIDGKAPYATARLDKSNCDSIIITGVDFSLDKKEGLSNGDKITVTALVDSQYLANRGCKATITTKEIEVSGLDTYIVGADNEYNLSELDKVLENDAFGGEYAEKIGDKTTPSIHMASPEEVTNEYLYSYTMSCWTIKELSQQPIAKYLFNVKKPNGEGNVVNQYFVIYEINGVLEKTSTHGWEEYDKFSVGDTIKIKKYQIAYLENVINTSDGGFDFSSIRSGITYYDKEEAMSEMQNFVSVEDFTITEIK